MPIIVDIDTIKRDNESAGYHWFDASSMRFFRSRLPQYGYQLNDGRRVFVSSEQFVGGYGERSHPRQYTIRVQDESGRVNTLGGFQEYASRSGANAAMLRYVNEQNEVQGDC